MQKKWMQDITTNRRYKLNDGCVCVIVNEFLRVECPGNDCKTEQFCRLTHVWLFNTDNKCIPNYNVSFHIDLELLKKYGTLIDEEKRAFEKEINGKWSLINEAGELLGEEEQK